MGFNQHLTSISHRWLKEIFLPYPTNGGDSSHIGGGKQFVSLQLRGMSDSIPLYYSLRLALLFFPHPPPDTTFIMIGETDKHIDYAAPSYRRLKDRRLKDRFLSTSPIKNEQIRLSYSIPFLNNRSIHGESRSDFPMGVSNPHYRCIKCRGSIYRYLFLSERPIYISSITIDRRAYYEEYVPY